jgi:hypothetical protein
MGERVYSGVLSNLHGVECKRMFNPSTMGMLKKNGPDLRAPSDYWSFLRVSISSKNI